MDTNGVPKSLKRVVGWGNVVIAVSAIMTVTIAVFFFVDKNWATPYVQQRAHLIIDQHCDSLGRITSNLQSQIDQIKRDEKNRFRVQRHLQEATMTPKQIQKARDEMVDDSIPPEFIYGR
jgi:hypothetical protein